MQDFNKHLKRSFYNVKVSYPVVEMIWVVDNLIYLYEVTLTLYNQY
jgi:hypothetical protein